MFTEHTDCGTWSVQDETWCCGAYVIGVPKPREQTTKEREALLRCIREQYSVGVLIFTDAVGGEYYCDWPEVIEDPFSKNSVWAIFQTPYARKLISEGLITESQIVHNENSGNPVMVWIVTTKSGEDVGDYGSKINQLVDNGGVWE